MIIILPLQISIITTFFLLIRYVLSGNKKHRRWFVLTLMGNIYFILIVLGLYAFIPSIFGELDGTFIFWISCGLFMILTLYAKVQVFINIHKRSKKRRMREEELKKAAMEAEDGEATTEETTEEDAPREKAVTAEAGAEEGRTETAVNEDKQAEEEGEGDLTTSNEMFVFLATMPFFLISSSYFIAKIIYFFLYDEF